MIYDRRQPAAARVSRGGEYAVSRGEFAERDQCTGPWGGSQLRELNCTSISWTPRSVRGGSW